MTFHRLQVRSDSVACRGTKVLLDGVELKVRSLMIEGAADDIWRCTVEFPPGALEVDLVVPRIEGGVFCGLCGKWCAGIDDYSNHLTGFGCRGPK